MLVNITDLGNKTPQDPRHIAKKSEIPKYKKPFRVSQE
jgi:hypothetical protein